MIKNLSNIPLFKGLSEEELEDNLNKIVFQKKNYPSGTLIITQGEDCNRLMILTEGIVKGEMISPAGKSLKIEDMEAPTVLASAFIFGEKNIFPVNIISSSDVSFIVIYKEELLKLFRINEQILKNFLKMISSRAQFLSEKLRFLSFKSLRAKIAFYISNEAGQTKTFKMRHSQQELADLFGVARPSVGRILLQLQEEGIIDIRYKQVMILNQSGLAKACSE